MCLPSYISFVEQYPSDSVSASSLSTSKRSERRVIDTSKEQSEPVLQYSAPNGGEISAFTLYNVWQENSNIHGKHIQKMQSVHAVLFDQSELHTGKLEDLTVQERASIYCRSYLFLQKNSRDSSCPLPSPNPKLLHPIIIGFHFNQQLVSCLGLSLYIYSHCCISRSVHVHVHPTLKCWAAIRS